MAGYPWQLRGVKGMRLGAEDVGTVVHEVVLVEEQAKQQHRVRGPLRAERPEKRAVLAGHVEGAPLVGWDLLRFVPRLLLRRQHFAERLYFGLRRAQLLKRREGHPLLDVALVKERLEVDR